MFRINGILRTNLPMGPAKEKKDDSGHLIRIVHIDLMGHQELLLFVWQQQKWERTNDKAHNRCQVPKIAAFKSLIR